MSAINLKALFLNPAHSVGESVGLTTDEFSAQMDELKETYGDENLTNLTITAVGHYANGDVLVESVDIETLINGERMVSGYGTVLPMGALGKDTFSLFADKVKVDVNYSGEHDDPETEISVAFNDGTVFTAFADAIGDGK